MECRRGAGLRRRALSVWACMAALLAAPAAASAGDVRAQDPVALARAGRCEEALPGLAARRSEREPALLEGECLVKLRRYGDAAPLLEALVQREDGLAEAWLDLGIA